MFSKVSTVPLSNVGYNHFLSQPSKFTNKHYAFKINIFIPYRPETESTTTMPPPPPKSNITYEI
jgi:hypothetical protein